MGLKMVKRVKRVKMVKRLKMMKRVQFDSAAERLRISRKKNPPEESAKKKQQQVHRQRNMDKRNNLMNRLLHPIPFVN